MYIPPFTCRVSPVTYAAPLEARNTTAAPAADRAIGPLIADTIARRAQGTMGLHLAETLGRTTSLGLLVTSLLAWLVVPL